MSPIINKKLQKPRRLNDNETRETNGNRHNSQSYQYQVKFFIANSNSNCCSRGSLKIDKKKTKKLLKKINFNDNAIKLGNTISVTNHELNVNDNDTVCIRYATIYLVVYNKH
jgi:hypothetical protein